VSAVEEIVVSADRPCACSTHYTSVLASGVAQALPDGDEKTVLLNLLTAKYAAGRDFQPIEEKDAARCAVVEIQIEEISGKKNVTAK
jgi:nitroimidazol reductase NimA-like FMN-containing flavoprotein (pyridoxamine 5'-phosphate oxidase superfamily)